MNFIDLYGSVSSIDITLDGPKDIHNKCRIYHDGRGNFDDAYKAFKDIKKRSNYIGTKVTISPENLLEINNIINEDLITFIDVNQGDSILLKMNNKSILIDTGGGNKDYSSQIKTYINSLGLNKIDYLILTHGDSDHLGSAYNLLDIIKVDNVILNKGNYNNYELNIISKCNNKNINYQNNINKINIDNKFISFLNNKIYDDENDNSIVVYININNIKILLMGDASIKTEIDILNKYNLNNIDIFKAGHHGSNTSSSKIFIDKIKPKYSIISVGKNNRYGHPKDEVLDTLKNSKIYRTDLDGSIEIKLNKNGYKIRTCPP